MKSLRYAIVLTLVLPWAVVAAERMNSDELAEILEKLSNEELWGEAVFEGGWVRSFKIETMDHDSIAVREVFGALQERSARYHLDEIYSVRALGKNRITLQRPVFSRKKSMPVALTLGLVPGLGHFYLGQPGKGLIMVGLAGAAVSTAFLTGEDGAAGWVPLGTWFYLASLWDVRDEVGAINASAEGEWSIDIKPGRTLAGRIRYSF
jgi:TM2 domain-containing membrane protein YozV